MSSSSGATAVDLTVLLGQLRCLVTAASARYQYEAAAFYASKAITLSNAAPRDVYAMADALYLNGEAVRALRTLETQKYLDPELCLSDAQNHAAARALAARQSPALTAPIPLHVLGAASRVQAELLPFFYLAALCFKKLKAWDKCLALLESVMEGPGLGATEPLLTPLRPDPLCSKPSSSNAGKGEGGKKQENNQRALWGRGTAAMGVGAASANKSSFTSRLGAHGPGGRGRLGGQDSHAPQTPKAAPAFGAASPSGILQSAAKAQESPSMFFSPSDQWMSPAGTTSAAAAGGGASSSAPSDEAVRRQKESEEEQAAALRNVTWRLLQMMAHHNGAAPMQPHPDTHHIDGDHANGDHEDEASGRQDSLPLPREHRLNLIGCMCQLRAEALMSLGHPTRAKHWFLASLHLEPQLSEAAMALIDHHLLTDYEETALQSSMLGRLSVSFQRLKAVSMCTPALASVAPADAVTAPEGGSSAAVAAGGLASSGFDLTGTPGHNWEFLNESEDDDDDDDEGAGGQRHGEQPQQSAAKRQKRHHHKSPLSSSNTNSSPMSADGNNNNNEPNSKGPADSNVDGYADGYAFEAPEEFDRERFGLHLYSRGSSALQEVPGLVVAAAYASASVHASSALPAQQQQHHHHQGLQHQRSGAPVSAKLPSRQQQQPQPSAASTNSLVAVAAKTPAAAATALPSTVSVRTRARTGSSGSLGASTRTAASARSKDLTAPSSMGGSTVSLGVGPSQAADRAAARQRVAAKLNQSRMGASPAAPGAPAASPSPVPAQTGGAQPALNTAARAQLRRIASASNATASAGGNTSWSAVLGPATAATPPPAPAPRPSVTAAAPNSALKPSAADSAITAPQSQHQHEQHHQQHHHQVEAVTVDYRWLHALLFSMRMFRKPSHSNGNAAIGGDPTFALEQTYCLGTNYDVLSAKAEALLSQHYDASAAYAITRRLMIVDPFDRRTALLHYSCLSALKLSQELFALAHSAVKANPKDALSWYAVGCYYSTVGKHEAASKNFIKATQLEPSHAPSWVGLGHAYAAANEHEPALAAYRAAMALLPNSHVPPMSMAAVCVRSSQLTQAAQFLALARGKCGSDPLLFHESGVLCHRMGDYTGAVRYFETVAEMTATASHALRRQWEPTFFNLGHALRKLGRYADAIASYERALALVPNNPQAISALGLTHHMAGAFDKAIGCYHAALALDYDDALSQRMLMVALEDSIELQRPTSAVVAGKALPGVRGYAVAASRGLVSGLEAEAEELLGDEGSESNPDGTAGASLFGGGSTVMMMAVDGGISGLGSAIKTPGGSNGRGRLDLLLGSASSSSSSGSGGGFLKKAPLFSAGSSARRGGMGAGRAFYRHDDIAETEEEPEDEEGEGHGEDEEEESGMMVMEDE